MFHGSNQVAADQFEVHVDDVLSETQLSKLHTQCFANVKLPKEAFLDNTVDCATKAAWLQNSLMQFFKDCSWHGEVRAFAGQHELTLKPHQWSEYFSAYIDSDCIQAVKPAKPIDGSLVKAWNYLKHTDNVRIAVTTYSKYESIVGRLQTLADPFDIHKILDVWKLLPDTEKTLRVVVQFIKIGSMTFLNAHAEEAYSIINRHFGAEKTDECNAFLSELLAKSGCWCLSFLPPRVLGNVFSDAIYEELSPNTYTRNDVLARVKLCGDVLRLHGTLYLDDLEVMEAALESCFQHRLPYSCCVGRSALLKDKQFMIKAVLKNKRNLELAYSQIIYYDPDVYAAAQTQECKQALKKASIHYASSHNGFHPNPVEAAYILAYYKHYSHNVCIVDPQSVDPQKKFFIDNDAMLDIISHDASVLERIAEHADRLPVLSEAANELVNDKQFMLACVRKNWHTVFQVVDNLPHLKIEAEAAAFASFGPARWAALHSGLRINVADD